MIAAVADTHPALWYMSADSRLSAKAKLFIDESARDGNLIAVSSISFVEMVYLVEKGRISPNEFSQLAADIADDKTVFVESPIDLIIARALTRVDAKQVPDMPDRLIAATAVKLGVPLISRDGKIRLSDVQTVW